MGRRCLGCWICRDFPLFPGVVTHNQGNKLLVSGLWSPGSPSHRLCPASGGEPLGMRSEVPKACERVCQRWEFCVVHAVSHRTVASLVFQCECMGKAFRSREHWTVRTALMLHVCTSYNIGGSKSNYDLKKWPLVVWSVMDYGVDKMFVLKTT